MTILKIKLKMTLSVASTTLIKPIQYYSKNNEDVNVIYIYKAFLSI